MTIINKDNYAHGKNSQHLCIVKNAEEKRLSREKIKRNNI